jgi:hypothetical protein
MGRFLDLTSRGRADRKEKFPARRAEYASSTQAFLEETIGSIHEAVQNWPAEWVFDLDEVGISDWEDRKPNFIKKFTG